MRTGVVIVTFNCLDMFRATMAHFKRNTPVEQCEVIVIDNNSEDGTKEYLVDISEQIHIQINAENMGYGNGNNQGADIAKSLNCERIILLNPDTRPHPGWFEAIHETMDRYSNDKRSCGIVGAKLLDYSNPNMIVHGGTYWKYEEGLHLTGSVDKNEHDEEKVMKWVTGAVMMISKRCWDQCEGMEKYWFYGQDSLLCFKAWHKGFSVWYSPKCVVRHYEGYSMRQADQKVPEFKKLKQKQEGEDFKLKFAEYYREEYD